MTLMEQLEWHDDHFLLAGYRFALQHEATGSPDPNSFYFYKRRSQVEQYDRFLLDSGLMPERALELGIWDGGSAAFWVETLGLESYAAIDLQTKGDSPNYQRWFSERGQGRARTYWGVSQTDRGKLREIIAEARLDPLDLVIDDCSHMPGPTEESFEILFALLRPGGYYIIEDWAWALQPEFQPSTHPWGIHPALHPLVHGIVDLHGSRPDLIPRMSIYPDFVAIERGAASIESVEIGSLTNRRKRPWGRIAVGHGRAAAGRLKRGMSRRPPS